jgi:Icc-related predicted phosphoesterase
VKLALLSDLHGNLPDVPDSDVIVIAGDICPDNDHTIRDNDACAALQYDWLKTKWVPWAQACNREIVAIWGNHDFIGQTAGLVDELRKDVSGLSWLHGWGDYACACGITFQGHPFVHNLHRWAFNLDDDKLAKLDGMLGKADVWVTHGPPYGHCDKVAGTMLFGGDPHVGSKSLVGPLADKQPRLHVCGHIHEARGVSGRTHNVSFVDMMYRPYQDRPRHRADEDGYTIPVIEL